MNLIDQLMKEHREAEGLIAQLKASQPGAERDRLVNTLSDALLEHMAVEETFLYPIVGANIGDDREQGSENEHDLVRASVKEMNALRSEPGFQAAIAMLEAGIAHHVEDEENEVFPQLRERAADDIDQLDPKECKAIVADKLVGQPVHSA